VISSVKSFWWERNRNPGKPLDFAAKISILISHTFNTFKNLLAKYQPRGLKIRDFEIASIGIGHGISRLATINRRDFAAIEEIEIVLL
jgi:hypothetical protein